MMRDFRDVLHWLECFRRMATEEETHLLSPE
jgi:hypothetical protein